MPIREYNYHTWAAYMVREPKDKPLAPHFAAVLFDTRNEWTPAYDKHNSDSSRTVTELVYFAFPDRELLAMWVGEATAAKKNFYFFHVAKLGEAAVSVQVDVGV